MDKKKGKQSVKDSSKEPKKKKVSEILASMDQKKEKGSSSRAKESTPYLNNEDVPTDEEEDGSSFDEEEIQARKERSEQRPLEITVTDKQKNKLKAKERKGLEATERAKMEALKDGSDPFTVVIGSKRSVLEGEDTSDANVKDITVESFSVSARGKELLKDATVKISHGKKYGLVGPNGTGKSTLLKLLAWRKIPVPKNIDVLYVEQEVVGDDKSALQAVVSANEELVKLRGEAEALQSSNGEDDGEKLVELYERLQMLGSDAAEAQASKILAGLGFTKEMQVRETKSFSGGWRMRISLARALFVQPTLLLLDEPTNHLDLRAVLWLEEYLCLWKKTLVVVSHDRDFLNSVCTGIIQLHDQKLNLYRGNFDSYETAFHKNRAEMKKNYEKQVKAENRSGNRAQKKKVKDKDKDYSVEFHFPKPTELTPPLLQLLEVSFFYPDRPDFKLSDVDVGIDMGTRVAIVGPNGAGKSTLLNLLAGDLVPTEGEVRTSQTLRIGRYSQHFVDLLKMDENPVDYLLRLHPDPDKEGSASNSQEAVRAKLGKFGLPSGNHKTPIVNLSGGQKARVVFTSISMSKPHILLLDEPTNHLDMESIDALADALDEFSGGVVLVSHDSRLISRVCEDEEKSQIWVVEDGTVSFFDGTFEEYKKELQIQIREEVNE
ncbi:ABC transporter F family member 4 [Raphanus sativus]|uniref:ABC transporter F family member 4 n=1 Tax=Raphanus sativus TaxID=3726 RepID=A0A6J0LVS7_RAPSA|nr:ABC transporter F family member 4 [Raphanus sativus]KAJ4904815.1 ABC transporter F family member 4 [Raphanus sativus]